MPARSPLGPDQVERLIKLLGLLSSDYAGERAAAAAMADKLVRAHGLTWADVVLPALPPPPIPTPPPRPASSYARHWREPETPQEAAELCLRWPELLSDWERRFCRSLLSRWRTSAKQRGILQRIVTKVRAYAETSYG